MAIILAGRCVLSWAPRSEEHTSELQSQSNLVCRLLLEKKNNNNNNNNNNTNNKRARVALITVHNGTSHLVRYWWSLLACANTGGRYRRGARWCVCLCVC